MFVQNEILYQQAIWLIRAGYPDEAAKLTQACILLGHTSLKTFRLSLQAQLETLPISRQDSCKQIGKTPQSTNARLRRIGQGLAHR